MSRGPLSPFGDSQMTNWQFTAMAQDCGTAKVVQYWGLTGSSWQCFGLPTVVQCTYNTLEANCSMKNEKTFETSPHTSFLVLKILHRGKINC